MAPGRRKGACRAADLRQWKVGDLVLAKVKGFPAWPAMVSEPDKWGHSVDRKKVFVYFFGTRQIGFCSPADIEPFTEAKKGNMLKKRHGKGADYVRAAREIIDRFEKLKNKDQSTSVPWMDEVTLTNGSNSVESLADSDTMDEAPIAINGTFIESTDSTKVKCDNDFQGGGAATVTTQYHVHDDTFEDPTLHINTKEISLPLMCSKKIKSLTQAHKYVMEKGMHPAQRSNNTSEADSLRLKNLISPSSNIRKSKVLVERYGFRDASCQRSKRIRKSPDISEINNVDSPASVSSGSPGENDSEDGVVDSDTLTFNEGSSVECGYDLGQSELVIECSKGNIKLNQRLDFKSTAVIDKKRRKISRKRANSGTNELIGRIEKEPESEMEDNKSGQILPSDNIDLNMRCIDEEGDEHLPLVKRARVRMGRPSSEVREPDFLVQKEKSSELFGSRMVHLNASLNSDKHTPADRNPTVSIVELDNSSLTNTFPVNKPPLWAIKKHFSCSVAESSLPPSKRMHRALEAMSANVAEDVQTTFEKPSSMTSFMNASCFSALEDCANMSPGNKSEGETVLHNVDLSPNNASKDIILRCSADTSPLVIEKGPPSYVEVAAHDIPQSNYNPEPRSCDSTLSVDAVENSDCKDPSISSSCMTLPESVMMPQRPIPLTAVLGRELVSHEGKQEHLLRPSINNQQMENFEPEKPVKEDDLTRLSTKNSDPVSANVEVINCSTHDDTAHLACNVQNGGDTTNLSKLHMDKDNKDNRMFMVKGKPTVKDLKVITSPTTEARTSSLHNLPHLLKSITHSEGHLSCKPLSGIRSFSFPSGGSDSAGATPHNTSGCNMSASDNSVLTANSGCCSLDAPLPHDKPKDAGRQNGKMKASTALTSFEVNLGLLTRTKDSIGRATRIAIECGKLGLASKAVDILARYLEREPSLPKRVDLFFLVDSIVQCSRGLKGEISDMYPSAIQALLPRLLLAAAPRVSNGLENRMQCLKVLKLWQERRVLPESIIRHHIQELDSVSNPTSADQHCPHLQRNEQAFDDPHREADGMVDKYGSNSSFQLPGFPMHPMRKDEDKGCASDGESFEAVTPEHNSESREGQIQIAVKKKRNHMLKAVDDKLEPEDVATCQDQLSSGNNGRVHIPEVLDHRLKKDFPVICPHLPSPNNIPPAPPLLKKSPPSPPLETCPPSPPLETCPPSPPLVKSAPTAPPMLKSAPPVPPLSKSTLPAPPPPRSKSAPPPSLPLKSSPPPSLPLKSAPPPSQPPLHPPPSLPPPLPPLLSELPNPVSNVIESKLYKNDDKQNFTALRPVSTRIDRVIPDKCFYHAPANGNLWSSVLTPESSKAGSLGVLPVPHPLIQPLNSVPQVDGATSHNKVFESATNDPFGGESVPRPPIQHVNSQVEGAISQSVPPQPIQHVNSQADGAISRKKPFHLRPPRPTPSNQFSYLQADRRAQPREIPPLSYPNRFNPMRDTDRGNFYCDHDRYEAASSHNIRGTWGPSDTYLYGPRYPDRSRLSYARSPYGGAPRGPHFRDRNWDFTPRAMPHREFMPHRSPLDGPISLSSRGPIYWRPR